jgi:hypothetical protein
MLHILKASFFVSVWWIYDVEALYDVTNRSIYVTISRQCCRTKYFEPGWKLTRWAIFQHWILRPEVLNFDPSPLRIELRRGIYYFDHEPCSKFNSIKTSNIYTPMVYSIKNLNFIPVCTLLVFLFCFIMSQNPKEFWPFIPVARACLPICWKFKDFFSKCIHRVYIKYLLVSQVLEDRNTKMTPVPLVVFLMINHSFMAHLWTMCSLWKEPVLKKTEVNWRNIFFWPAIPTVLLTSPSPKTASPVRRATVFLNPCMSIFYHNFKKSNTNRYFN